MANKKRKPAKQEKLCGSCEYAVEAQEYKSIDNQKLFCVWCKKTGLLRVKKWKCEINTKNDRYEKI